MLRGLFDTRLDVGSVAIGAGVGAVAMLVTSVAAGGVTSQFSVIGLVGVAGITVSLPAGIATGLFSEGAETELQHGGFAGVFGTVLGLVLIGLLASARAPLPTISQKLDLLYLTMTWGLGTLVFVFPFVFVSGGYLSRYVANLRWRYTADHDAEWGDKGRYENYEK